MGLRPDLQVAADDMISASMELVTNVMTGVRDTTLAVFHELAQQKGMAGADEGGRDFAKVYMPAAAATVDQMGFSAFMIGEGGAALMRSAREFIAQEDAIAASFMARQGDPTVLMGNPAEGCSERFIGLGEDLEDVVGKVEWDDMSHGGSPGAVRGEPHKLRLVAGTWVRAGTLMERFFVDAQGCGRTADKAHSGLAADAFRAHFTAFIGFADAPSKVQEDETLVANLVAACNQLAQGCFMFASHVEVALSRIGPDPDIFDAFKDDGGLQNLVLGDPYIHALGDIPHVLDSGRARVKLPDHAPPPPTPWYDRRPFSLIPRIEVPELPFNVPKVPAVPEVPVVPEIPVVPLSLASAPGLLPTSYKPVDPSIPFREPIPPQAGMTTPLSPADQNAFTAWANGFQASGFGGSTNLSNAATAYQLRVAGYPERIIPIKGGTRPAVAADGLRSSDGYAVDAKKVTNPRTCYRYGSTYDLITQTDGNGNYTSWKARLVNGDRDELARYKLAIDQYPQLHGLEIDTDDPDSAAYWETLMTEEGVPGYARYVL
jgi:hypothetical protein